MPRRFIVNNRVSVWVSVATGRIRLFNYLQRKLAEAVCLLECRKQSTQLKSHRKL